LPDRSQGSRLEQLNAVLRVWLCDEKGRKLVQLPVKNMVGSLEPPDKGPPRGTKLVLFVRESGSGPARRELSEMSSLYGVTEDIAIVEVSPRTLPGSALGYEGVDAVVWAAGGPPDVAVSGEGARYRALREWVGGGGRLVVMQHGEWRRTAAWGEILPVRLGVGGDGRGTVTRSDLGVLTRLSGVGEGTMGQVLWEGLRGPHVYGIAEAKEGAVVEEWLDLTGAGRAKGKGGEKTVWMARMGVGAGCVTYVAQDLGSPLLVPRSSVVGVTLEGGGGEAPGWARIWSRVLDYRYAPLVASKGLAEELVTPYRPARSAHEMGRAVLGRMEMTSKAGALIGVSVVFFVLYWLAAGPGMWLFLKSRGKLEWSWVGFAAVAGVGTVLTVVVVRVVLMGDAQVRHFSVVRMIPGEPARVESRVGLYVPRDGDIEVALGAGSGLHSAAIGPYAIHPGHAANADEFAGNKKYEVETREVAGEEGARVVVPFRSTLKRLQTTWRGELKEAISGNVAVAGSGQALLTGRLNNGTGKDLRNVYLVFKSERSPNPGQDRLVFIAKWLNGEQLKLEDVTDQRKMKRWGDEGGSPESMAAVGASVTGSTGGVAAVSWALMGLPGRTFGVEDWVWADMQMRQMMLVNTPYDDSTRNAPRVWLMLGLFDRFPVMRNQAGSENRAEFLRWNARFLDVSAAVGAGRLVVMGQADGVPLPVPLRVDGNEVGGEGTILYQAVLPLDRSKEMEGEDEAESTTQPAPGPAAEP